MQFYKIAHAQFRDVANFAALRIAVSNFVNASAGAVDTGVIVAFASVAPIDDEHAAVRTGTDLHAAEPGVGRKEEVRSVFGDIAAALALENFLVSPAAVKIESEKMAAILSWPIIALINHHADVCVAAAEFASSTIARFLPA